MVSSSYCTNAVWHGEWVWTESRTGYSTSPRLCRYSQRIIFPSDTFNTFGVIPYQILIQCANKFWYFDSCPILIIEHLIFKRPNNTSQAALSGEQPFWDMERSKPAFSIHSISPAIGNGSFYQNVWATVHISAAEILPDQASYWQVQNQMPWLHSNQGQAIKIIHKCRKIDLTRWKVKLWDAGQPFLIWLISMKIRFYFVGYT